MNHKYEAPNVRVMGSVEALTSGTTSGMKTDANLPSGTPVSQIPGFIASHLS